MFIKITTRVVSAWVNVRMFMDPTKGGLDLLSGDHVTVTPLSLLCRQFLLEITFFKSTVREKERQQEKIIVRIHSSNDIYHLLSLDTKLDMSPSVYTR